MNKIQEAAKKLMINEEFAPVTKVGNRDRNVQAMVESQLQYMADKSSSSTIYMNEDSTTNQTAAMAQWNPMLINMVRRAAPQLIAHDLAGVQPLQASTGLIFAMRRRYNDQKGPEALVNEPNSGHSGTGDSLGDSSGFGDEFEVGSGMITSAGEGLGGDGKEAWPEMAISVEKMTVEAKSRKLKAQISRELEQDMRSNHNLSATSELTNLLSDEIRAESDREIIRKINRSAVLGAQNCLVPGTFDLHKDADGRHLQERLRALIFQVEMEANHVNRATRRGQANRIVASQNVVSAFNLVGLLDYNPSLAASLNTDTASSCFAGVLFGKYAVFIDPYAEIDYINVTYKGANAWDAGMYFCPYTPLEMVNAVNYNTMDPVIGFTTRYAIAANPFNYQDAKGTLAPNRGFGRGENTYSRIFKVVGLY